MSQEVLQQIEIQKFAAEGKSIAKIDGLVVFVKNAIPGDIVDLQITKKKKNFWEAKAIKFHKLSEKRTEPKCQHFGVCGGCKWQNVKYEFQLEFKHNQVVETFEHIAKIKPQQIKPIIPSPDIYFYRNKLEYTFSVHRWLTENTPEQEKNKPALGFHAPLKFDKVVDIQKCWLQPEPSNQIRNFVRQLAFEKNYQFYNIRQHTGFLRNLIIRNNLKQQFMVILQVAQNKTQDIQFILDQIQQNFPQVVSLYYILNQKKNDSYADLTPIHYKGQPYLIEQLDNFKFQIHPKSFFQTNTKQALNLYRTAKQFAQLTGNEIVYDLYTGTGTIAIYISDKAKQVIGIEYIQEAIQDAKNNAKINNVSNTSFFAGDIKDILTQDFIQKNGKPDVIITDPPRAGMHKTVIQAIKYAKPKRIVYISCNPATQARDIALLADMYHLVTIQPVDMFPHTYHVENIALLERKL